MGQVGKLVVYQITTSFNNANTFILWSSHLVDYNHRQILRVTNNTHFYLYKSKAVVASTQTSCSEMPELTLQIAAPALY